jgi:hypothetical protein
MDSIQQIVSFIFLVYCLSTHGGVAAQGAAAVCEDIDDAVCADVKAENICKDESAAVGCCKTCSAVKAAEEAEKAAEAAKCEDTMSESGCASAKANGHCALMKTDCCKTCSGKKDTQEHGMSLYIELLREYDDYQRRL